MFWCLALLHAARLLTFISSAWMILWIIIINKKFSPFVPLYLICKWLKTQWEMIKVIFQNLKMQLCFNYTEKNLVWNLNDYKSARYKIKYAVRNKISLYSEIEEKIIKHANNNSIFIFTHHQRRWVICYCFFFSSFQRWCVVWKAIRRGKKTTTFLWIPNLKRSSATPAEQRNRCL